METMRQRIGGGCVRNFSIQLEKNDTIIVELPGVTDGKEAAEIIRENDDLEFYHMEDVKSERNCSGKWKINAPVTSDEGHTFCSVQDGTKIDSYRDPRQVLQKVVNAYDPTTNPYGTKPCLTGKHLIPNATTFLDSHRCPTVEIQLDHPAGTKALRALARSHRGDYLGVFYNGRLLTYTVIQQPEADGSVCISGFDSSTDAKRVAMILNLGAMPVSLEIISISKSPEHYAF